MGYIDVLCGAMRARDFAVRMCEREKMLALASRFFCVNTLKILDMEKMEGCLLEIKEENENVVFVAGEQRCWYGRCCRRGSAGGFKGKPQNHSACFSEGATRHGLSPS
jgi:hypothetical protein